MSKQKVIANSYEHILQQAGAYDSVIDQVSFKRNILNLNQHQIPTITYMTDMIQRKYLAIAGSDLIGYKEYNFLSGGLDFYIDCWQRDDFEIYNNQVFPDLIRFLKDHPSFNLGNAIFSFIYRIKTRFGKEMSLLQRTSYITHPNTNVFLCSFGVAFDITHFNKDPGLTYTIENREDQTLLFKKVYFTDDHFTEISKRELEVMKWLSDGLSSKQIAEKMKLSINTINNHRKHMLHKTNSKTSSELIKNAIHKGLI